MKKIMLLANRDFVLYNFRFELIQKLIDEGREVVICLPYGPKVDLMTKAGARFIPLEVDGRGKNPVRDIKLFNNIERIYASEKPDIVLLFTTKVCIYGGMAAAKMQIPYIINVSGLGTAVYQPGPIQKLTVEMYKKAISKALCVFFQNEQGKEFFKQHHIDADRERVIPGSGVNTDKWKYLEYPEENNGIHFLFAARLIKEKGIEEYLECAKRIKKTYKNAFFHIAGPDDGGYEGRIKQLEKQGIVKYHGQVDDIGEILKLAHCLIHPSYYPEGISNVCLEASASGRPVITTDTTGCRDTVSDGISGYVVKSRNIAELIKCVDGFISSSFDDKREMGIKAREKVVREFNRNDVIAAYMNEIEKLDFDKKDTVKDPIRVLHMIASLEMGGSQSMVMNIYRNIDREKVQFDFIIDHTDRDDYRSEIESLGGKIFVLPTFRGVNYFEIKKAWNSFFDEHPEYKILHTHSRSYASVYLPIAKNHGLKTIAHSHSTSNGKKAVSHIKDFMQLPIRFQADYMFACSLEAGEWLFGKKATKSDKFRIIPNSIDFDKFKYDERVRKKVRTEYGLTDSFVVGHVGRMIEAKNHFFLLECFKEFKKLNPDSKLLLVGDGKLMSDVKNYAGELGVLQDTIFTGNTDSPQDYYQAMDCFVFPSLWEGFGMSVIEAEAVGLSCIVSDVIPKSVDMGVGLVSFVSLGEGPAGWADRINGCNRIHSGNNHIYAEFDITNSAQKLQSFYEDIY
ncbi:glycosyltransferase [Butyrivibrio sp. FCS014]|uniref:glycosyltransferase n=1 Tax=Butyrivibrio sp. FCS014 TaxID=1408304 RepID=UPI0009DF61F8|nr:glycosyltransferase [Butyrivibrio sp. FCS014]